MYYSLFVFIVIVSYDSSTQTSNAICGPVFSILNVVIYSINKSWKLKVNLTILLRLSAACCLITPLDDSHKNIATVSPDVWRQRAWPSGQQLVRLVHVVQLLQIQVRDVLL